MEDTHPAVGPFLQLVEGSLQLHCTRRAQYRQGWFAIGDWELDVSPTSMDTKRNRWDRTTKKGEGKKSLVLKLNDFCCRSRQNFGGHALKWNVLQIKHLQFFSVSLKRTHPIGWFFQEF